MTFNTFNFDLIEILSKSYQNIDKRYKIAFGISFTISILAYFIFISQFLINNHQPRMPWMGPKDQFLLGRWFTVVIFNISNYADIPVFNPIFATIINVFNGLLVSHLWEKATRPLSTAMLTSITLLISLYPATLSAYYFTHTTIMFVSATLIATMGLIVSSSLKFTRILIGAVLIMLAMATYQPSLSVFATLFMSLFVLLLAEHKGNRREFLDDIKTSLLPKLLSIVLGGIFYRLSLPILGIKIGQIHSTKTMQISEMPARIAKVFEESVKSLIYTQPEILTPIKEILFAVLSIAGLVVIIVSLKNSSTVSSRIKKSFAMLLLIAGTVLATKALFVISSDSAFAQYRYNFSLAYLYAFGFFILFLYLNWPLTRNITLLICMLVVLRFGQADLIRQAVLLRGQQHDMALANRILYRIESLPEIDYEKQYFLVRTGAYPRMRTVALQSKGHKYDRGGDGHMDRGEISDIWTPASVMPMLGSKVKWKGLGVMPEFNKKMKTARELAKKQGRKPWPHPSSVFIYKDWIIVYM